MTIRKYVDYIPTVYERDKKRNLRFVLGNYGNRTLICVGINPNTANSEYSDPTMNDLVKFSKSQGYDSCIMINPYPLICSDPSLLPQKFDLKICEENITYIRDVFKRCKNGDLLLSWGEYITRNDDFRKQTEIIINMAKESRLKLIHINSLTKSGNPRHFRGLCRDKMFNAGNYVVNEIKY